MNLSETEIEQLEKHWRSNYRDSKDLLDGLKSLKVFVGFNMDVDFIYKLESQQLERLISRKDIRREVELRRGHSFSMVEDFTSFLTSLLDSIDASEPKELDLANKSVRDEIKSEFTPEKKSIGGQAGIISNFLAGLGVETVVYTPVLSPEQIKYLHSDLLYPRVADSELVLDNVTSCANAPETKNNLVFEYPSGLKVPQFDITADKAGRFILSDFLTDFTVSLPTKLMQKSDTLFSEVDKVILSGYHDLADKNFYSRLRRAGEQLDKLQEADSSLKIHLELASQKNVDLEKEIISQIAAKVDSLGFDSTELPQTLRAMREINLASQVEPGSFDLFHVYQALKAVVTGLDLERCQLHCDRYLVCLVRDDYPRDQSAIRDSLLLGGNAAVAKASRGKIPDKELIKDNYNCQLSEQGLKDMSDLKERLELPSSFLEEGYHQFQSENLTLVVVPALLAESVETLVGLGDVISAASFIGESASD